ncbi:hypothetical protein LIER_34132 [Lithospermum erythrorhizon]|uniref:Uncharacterized protein n=1 Tax=Lithospermum erythrorhizon TaxID=34254 RepID=A0AAV3S280_LITER
MMMISQHIQFKAWSPSPPLYKYSSSPSHIHQTPLYHSQLLKLVPAQIRYKNPSNAMSILPKETSSSDAVFDVLGDVSIFNATGESLNFKDLWDPKEGIAVVALLRHFGCPCSWEFADALKEIKPRLDAAGVRLIAIGVGTPNKARLLAERLPFPLDCLYADPNRKAYDILGLYYGFGRTFFNPASVIIKSPSSSLYL